MSEGPARRVTLAEVARSAGVSAATASRVLHGGDRVVARDLRERVLDAARRLRYVPNSHAQALAGGLTPTVGLIMHDVSDPYFSAIVRGAISVAAENGAVVMLGSTFRSMRTELDYVATFLAQRARAILLVGSGFGDEEYLAAMGEQLARHRDSGGRYAFISEHHLPGDAVLPDNVGGAAAMARALFGLGHRCVAVAGGPARLVTITHRINAFIDALADAGIPRTAVRVIERDFDEEGGRAAARAVIADHPEVTALFCVSDVMAIGALTELKESGITVPDELSVVGFGDISIARHLTPALSTVRLDLEGMGRAAMQLVHDDRGGDEDKGGRQVRFPAEVMLRASTGPPRAFLGHRSRGARR